MALAIAQRLAHSRGERLSVLSFPASEDDAGKMAETLGEHGVDEYAAIITPAGHAPDLTARLARELALDQTRLIVVPATSRLSAVAARLGTRLSIPVVADCVNVIAQGDSDLKLEVATAGGMAWVDATPAQGVSVIVLMPLREIPQGDPVPKTTPRVQIVPMALPSASDGFTLLETVNVRKEDMTLAEAGIIVSGGRGLGGPEGFEPLTKLAQLIGAHVGASRVATDLGWIDRDHLVGMSGSTVRPSLYLAIGISGAPHHLMGMRDSTTIVALNTDESAPIMKLADHAFVGDVNAVVPKLISLLGG